jgi:hypothetical protein
VDPLDGAVGAAQHGVGGRDHATAPDVLDLEHALRSAHHRTAGKVRGDRGGDARLEPAERDGGPGLLINSADDAVGIHDHGRAVDARPCGQPHGEDAG